MTARKMDLKQLVGDELFHRAGLAKLSPEERAALADWLKARVARAIEQTEKNLARHGPEGPPPWPTDK